jgi:hypothetical protein
VCCVAGESLTPKAQAGELNAEITGDGIDEEKEQTGMTKMERNRDKECEPREREIGERKGGRRRKKRRRSVEGGE